MAEQVRRIIALRDETIVCSYAFDDADGTLLAAIVTNTSPVDAIVTVTGIGSQAGVVYERTFAAGSGETRFDIPPGKQKRFPMDPEGDGPMDFTVNVRTG